MAMKVQVVFWVLMFCSVAVGYQCFREPCCLHLQGEDGGSRFLKMLVSYCNILHSATTQKTLTY